MFRTPLYDCHKNAGAKFVEFFGWEMPILYTSIVQEHLAVRNAVGLFDISHMGQIFVRGDGALNFLQKICTNDVSKCSKGQAIYSHLCNEKGGVIDDIFIYYIDQNYYLVIVNASTISKDFDWMAIHQTSTVQIENRSAQLGVIALQGPLSVQVVAKLFSTLPDRHQISESKFGNDTVFLCRTGYTGEDGFEIVAPNKTTPEIWHALLKAGKEFNIALCGLGARDTLRLEMGYLLYGQDVDDAHTPFEAGVPWVVKLNKGDFIGRESLEQQKNIGLKRKLTAFKMSEKGIPRHGSKIYCDGKEVGTVTSGTFSPSLQCGIAMGYIPFNLNGKFSINCHSKQVSVSIVKLPFYKPKPKTILSEEVVA